MRTIVTLFLMLLIPSFGRAAELKAVEDLQLKNLKSGSTETLKKDQVQTLQDETYLVSPVEGQNSSFADILLVPFEKNSVIELNAAVLRENPTCTGPTTDRQQASKTLNETVLAIFEIQKLMSNRQPAEARTQLQTLINKNPDLSALHFLMASIHVLDGRRAEALQHVQEGLKTNPQYLDGQSLLKALRNSGGIQ